MESALVSSSSSSSSHVFSPSSFPRNFTFFLKTSNFKPNPQSRPARLIALSAKPSDSAQFTTPSSDSAETSSEAFVVEEEEEEEEVKWNVEVGVPNVPPYAGPASKLTLSDQAFFLLAFIACTTSVAFTSLVVAAVPTLYAMGRAATSLSKLADTAREELPSTMAAIRLSGMEISDLTLELSDLSQEIADGVNKSAQAVRAAEAGIRQIGSLAHHPTVSMIQERASQPIASLQPVVAGAAKKTTRAVGQATKTLMSFISRVEFNSESREGNGTDRVDN